MCQERKKLEDYRNFSDTFEAQMYLKNVEPFECKTITLFSENYLLIFKFVKEQRQKR